MLSELHTSKLIRHKKKITNHENIFLQIRQQTLINTVTNVLLIVSS